MQKITPFRWFDAQAEEAVAFYPSVFKDGKIQTDWGGRIGRIGVSVQIVTTHFTLIHRSFNEKGQPLRQIPFNRFRFNTP